MKCPQSFYVLPHKPLAVGSNASDVLQRTLDFLPRDDEQISSAVVECRLMTGLTLSQSHKHTADYHDSIYVQKNLYIRHIIDFIPMTCRQSDISQTQNHSSTYRSAESWMRGMSKHLVNVNAQMFKYSINTEH